MFRSEVNRFPSALRLNGVDYLFDGYPSSQVVVELTPSQPGDSENEFERRIENWAMGWGSSRFEQPGTYDYGLPAVMHRRGVFLPGAAVTALSPATAPTGNVSFCEYWDGVAANRRLIAVAARHVYEIDASGNVTISNLTAIVPATARMGRGVCFKVASMSAPKVFIPVQNGGATDYFIVRTAASTYIENAGNKIATALAAIKDIDGEDIMVRADENGRLNVTTANADPSAGASWAGSTYGVGSVNSKVLDLFMQNRAIIAGKEDGAYTFDSRLNTIPITPGFEQTPDADNFTYIKDVNGMAVAPTAAGILWIDGLDYGVCGPVSANDQARNLRGPELAVSAMAGKYCYASVYYNSNSYIFLGTPRLQGDVGEGPFTWHGPIAVVTGFQVQDLFVSTVWGTKLWWGAAAKFGYINLKSEDFSPATDATSGYIYLPEGILDIDGPGIIKDFRKVEFVTRAGAPFSATNAWTFEVETTPGSGTYVAVDGGATGAGDGVLASRYWTTETSGKRLRCRIGYSGNSGGTAELEAVVVRGTERPEMTEVYNFTIKLRAGQRMPAGHRRVGRPNLDWTTLEALQNSGRKVAMVYGERTLTGRITNIEMQEEKTGKLLPGEMLVKVRFRRVVTS